MLNPKHSPILTDRYESASEFRPEDNSIYIYGSIAEERSEHFDVWKAKTPNITFIQICSETGNEFKLRGEDSSFSLRSSKSLRDFWSPVISAKTIYIDITSLTHPVWAGLIKSAINEDLRLSIIYVEPLGYTPNPTPYEGDIYDLSMKITGVAPLAGFATLSEPSHRDSKFIALLGFEGTRFRHLIENLQPNTGDIIPIIGCPGFKTWYPFETFLSNKPALQETEAWQSVRYAAANCPFQCFYLLQQISQEYPQSTIKIAMIGTKPHALGAVLFYIANTEITELVYDHPIRKENRTTGSDRLLVYHISALAAGVKKGSKRDRLPRPRLP